MQSKRLALTLLTLFFAGLAAAQGSDALHAITIRTENLPEIASLSAARANTVFKSYQDVVESNHRAVIQDYPLEYMFFRYTNTERFTVQSLAARCNIPQETIATLNRIEASADNINGRTLLLPTFPGLFVATEKGQNSLEVLLQENYADKNLTKDGIYYNINGRTYVFILNARLTPTERAYFQNHSLQLPINHDEFWVSSEFGKRKNPFSGELKNHNGIDLAAEEGTPVYAITDGAAAVVIENDPTFGNYIILSHNQGKMTSVYAHLSKICVEKYEAVKKGAVIGYVGQTGMATGPHLHFEIRQGGVPQDPKERLKLE